MPNLPFDCIANVINQIDCRHDLFMLLTVSRDVFQVAARRLYRDPLDRDWSFKRHQYDPRFIKLLRLLLSLSPANDHQTNRLRQAIDKFNASTSTLSPATTTTATTMLDYLSLVKVVHWSALLGTNRLSLEMTGRGWRDEELMATLTWAFVGHRLEEVIELDIMDIHLRADGGIRGYSQEWHGGGGGDEDEEGGAFYPLIRGCGDDRYLQHVSRMTNLRKIWICRSDHWDNDWNPFYSCVEKMILAMQRVHGPQQLQECRLTLNPLENGLRVQDASGSVIMDVSGAQRIYSLVSTATGGLAPNQYPTNSLLVVPCCDGSFVALDRLFDPELARIQSLIGPYENSSTGRRLNPELLTRLYSDLSDPQILQRCRGLTTLHLEPIAADSDCLAWAAYEAEYRRRTCSDVARPLVLTASTAASASSLTTTATLINSSVIVAPLVALQSLYLEFEHTDPNITLKPLWDGLQGFSNSLEWLTVKCSCHRSPRRLVSEHLQQRPRVLRSSVPLPRLKRLDLEEMEIDPSFWRLAPLIEDVRIRVPAIRYTTAATSSLSENPQEITSTSTGTTAVDPGPLNLAAPVTATPAVPVTTPADIVLDCPVLNILTLDKGAVRLFDPASFKTSGQYLQQLTLTVACPWNTSYLIRREAVQFSCASHHCPYCCKCSYVERMASIGNGDGDHDDNGGSGGGKDGYYALYVRHPDRWTWGWSFPQLTRLLIHGDLLALRFDLVSLLRSCPSLVDINLGHVPARCHLQDSFPLTIKDQVLDIVAPAVVETNAGAGAHFHASSLSSSTSLLSVPSVQTLSLSGKWSIQAAELACLLDVVLPGLSNLHVHNDLMDFMTDEHGATDYRGVVCLTKNHPALRTCAVDSLVGIEQVLQQHEQDDHKREQQARKYLDEQLEPMGLTRDDLENVEAHVEHKIVYMFWNFAYQLQKGPEKVQAL